MTQTRYYDAIVIGAGQAGGPLSTELARTGWKTALIEREHVGGTCINEGCTPTKTMVASARVAYLARRGADYGVQTGPVTLEVRLKSGETQQLTAGTIFLNAGDRPAKPALSGIENVSTLDSTSIMELDMVPEHLLVVGGGYVGLEFGQMFRRFGSRVTIIQRGAYLLTREDADVAGEVANI